MKRENFLQRCESQDRDVDDCISDVKEYCGMQRIGGSEITEELMACIRREKCSLPVVPDPKRVTAFNNGWQFQKKHLKYYLMNTASRTNLNSDELWKVVDMSVAAWACHTQLNFSRASSIQDADIFVEFSQRNHQYVNYFTKAKVADPYAFDGPGGTLAHAFYPTQHPVMGNFHYDDEETWIENKGTGIKLLHVTIHELGHNLGLDHIHTVGNIMYPAYDPTFHETELDLGSLDKYQIQSRYGAKQCVDKVWQTYYEQKYPDPARSCKDKTSSCGSYTWEDCSGSKKAWMKENCANHCGFCGSCEDLTDHCRNYRRCNPKDSWFQRNCKTKCSYCPAKATFSWGQTGFSGENANKQAICKARKLDGIFVGKGKTKFIIANGTMYRSPDFSAGVDPKFRLSFAAYNTTGLRYPTASAYSQATKRLFLFEGNKMFIVKNFRKPKRAKVQVVSLPKSVRSPSGAFIPNQNKSDVISLVKGRRVVTVQLQDGKLEQLNAKTFTDVVDAGKYKNRIPRKIDAVYQDGKKVSFFVGSSLLLAYEQDDGRLALPAGPRPFMTAVLKCPQTL